MIGRKITVEGTANVMVDGMQIDRAEAPWRENLKIITHGDVTVRATITVAAGKRPELISAELISYPRELVLEVDKPTEGIDFYVKAKEKVLVRFAIEAPDPDSAARRLADRIHEGKMEGLTVVDDEEVKVDCPEGWFEFDDKWFGKKDFGKYKPNLLIIAPQPELKFEPLHLNVPWRGAKLSHLIGTFFTTKKGTKAFRVDPTGLHVLICDSWGGCFNSYRGGNWEPVKPLYYRCACSNGGGAGNDWIVIDRGKDFVVSVDDV